MGARLSLIFAVSVLFVAGLACSPGLGNRKAATPASSGFPDGYGSWTRLNPRPILRKAEGESRVLYANAQATIRGKRFAPGAVLVKEQRRLEGDRPGAPFLVATMTKLGDGSWRFDAYDPTTGQSATTVDLDGCALCHSGRAATDETFRAFGALAK